MTAIPGVPGAETPGQPNLENADDDFKSSLDRIGRYLADCVNAESHSDPALTCMNHPITVGDLWTLYCERGARSGRPVAHTEKGAADERIGP